MINIKGEYDKNKREVWDELKGSMIKLKGKNDMNQRGVW